MPSAFPPGETCWVSRVVVCPVTRKPVVISLRYITIPLAWWSGGQNGQTYATESGGPGITILSFSRVAGSKVCPGRKGGPSGSVAGTVTFGEASAGSEEKIPRLGGRISSHGSPGAPSLPLLL